MKILLMGNGSSVMDNEFGKKIDNDFDLVYRINRFKTKGYEKNVGTKVDAWFLADNGVQWLENETVADRIIEITPGNVHDKLMSYKEFLEFKGIRKEINTF